jgi:hypothetical protein
MNAVGSPPLAGFGADYDAGDARDLMSYGTLIGCLILTLTFVAVFRARNRFHLNVKVSRSALATHVREIKSGQHNQIVLLIGPPRTAKMVRRTAQCGK